MTITIDVGPDLEDRLQAKAAAQGVSVKEFVEGLVRQAANGAAVGPLHGGSRPSVAEFEADWAAFAQGLDHLEPLPPEAFSREAMYSERD